MNQRMRKAMGIIARVVTALIAVFAVFVMVFTIISVNTVGRDADFFGYKPYIVLSDSMQDTFAVGDLAVSKKVDPETLQPGDIVTFESIDPANYGEVVTHKIREITTYEGKQAFVTYGTTTGVDDTYPALFENVIGEYVFKLPKMGYFFNFLKSPSGYFLVILIPFAILILAQALHFFKLVRQYKAEQQEELNAQKRQMEEEREKSRQMEEELQRLRAQIADAQSANNENRDADYGISGEDE